MLGGPVYGVVLGEILLGRGQEEDKQRKEVILCGSTFAQFVSAAPDPAPSRCWPPGLACPRTLSRGTRIQQIFLSTSALGVDVLSW